MTRTTTARQQIANKIELEALEKSMAESPEEESDQYTVLDGVVESDKPSTLIIDGVEFLDGKRRVKSKPKCNPAISSGHWYSVANPIVQTTNKPNSRRLGLSWQQVLSWLSKVGLRLQDERYGKKIIWHDATEPVHETSFYRAKLDDYRVEFPQSEIAEHEIFGRKSRNASAKFGDAKLASLRAYMDLHRTIEPNRSLWNAGVARSDKQEHGPTPEKMEEIWSDPSIKYENLESAG